MLGDRLWPQTAKQDRDRMSEQFLCSRKRNERPNVGGVSIRSRNGAPYSKGMRVQWSNNQGKRQMITPPTCEGHYRLASLGRP